MTNSKNKKDNIFVSYFKNFGLKQVADLLILAASIVIIIGLFMALKFTGINYLTLIGACVYLVGIGINSFLVIRTLKTVKNHRAPQYKQAFINIFILGALFILAVLLIIYSIV